MIDYIALINPVIFFPVTLLVCLCYYLLPGQYRWILLLVLSYAFYFLMVKNFIVLLALLTIINYVMGQWIERSLARKRPLALALAIAINLLPFLFFKFASAGWLSEINSILLPVGLAFYTLQNLSYLIDVSNARIKAERHLGHFAVYAVFFPKILAGPIERGKDFLPQLKIQHPFHAGLIYDGLRQICIGMFKKLVIANRLAIFVNEVFDNPGSYQGFTVIVAIIFLAFQIYLDFSGYTDIAIGTARLLGFKLTSNFAHPYLSKNLVEFWTRWHISFSTWLRDYIFYPLRRKLVQHSGQSMSLLALMIPPLLTMVASGFWHGAGMTFLVWGMYNAVFYILVIVNKSINRTRSREIRLVGVLKVLLSFGIICGGWVIFRSKTLLDAVTIVRSIFVKSTTFEHILQHTSAANFYLSIILVILIVCWEVWSDRQPNTRSILLLPQPARWIAYFLILAGITLFGVFPMGATSFVYFQF